MIALENIKMVQGVQGKRKISSITRQQEVQRQLKKECFSYTYNKINVSDICMSVGFYILMPLFLILVLIYTITVY